VTFQTSDFDHSGLHWESEKENKGKKRTKERKRKRKKERKRDNGYVKSKEEEIRERERESDTCKEREKSEGEEKIRRETWKIIASKAIMFISPSIFFFFFQSTGDHTAEYSVSNDKDGSQVCVCPIWFCISKTTFRGIFFYLFLLPRKYPVDSVLILFILIYSFLNTPEWQRLICLLFSLSGISPFCFLHNSSSPKHVRQAMAISDWTMSRWLNLQIPSFETTACA
jgi:hypothetical protein